MKHTLIERLTAAIEAKRDFHQRRLDLDRQGLADNMTALLSGETNQLDASMALDPRIAENTAAVDALTAVLQEIEIETVVEDAEKKPLIFTVVLTTKAGSVSTFGPFPSREDAEAWVDRLDLTNGTTPTVHELFKV